MKIIVQSRYIVSPLSVILLTCLLVLGIEESRAQGGQMLFDPERAWIAGCDGVINSGKVVKACGCDDEVSCLDCNGVPNGGATAASFQCKQCFDNTSCLDCNGQPFGFAKDLGCGCGKPVYECDGRTVCSPCDQCDLVVGDVQAHTGQSGKGFYSRDAIVLTQNAPSCLKAFYNYIDSKIPHYTGSNRYGHYADDSVVWDLIDWLRLGDDVFYNQLASLPFCNYNCYTNPGEINKCWCDGLARSSAQGRTKPTTPKIQCAKRSVLGTKDYMHFEGACVEFKFYMDSECRVVPPSQLGTRNVCNAADIDFYPSSPISLLWGSNEPITARGSLVHFPLDKSRSDSWYVWHGSSLAPLLVYDPEHRGRVTSPDQLFGNWTFGGKRTASLATSSQGVAGPWRDGYEALATLDGNGDGVISGSELDPLALWFDANRDAVAQDGEVKRLTDSGVTKLFLSNQVKDLHSRNVHVKRGYARMDGQREVIGETVDWYSEGASTQSELLMKQQLRHNSGGGVDPIDEVIELASQQPAVSEKDNQTGKFLTFAPIRGGWLWKAKRDDPDQPRGILIFEQGEGGELSGMAITEVPVSDPKKQVGFMMKSKSFAGTVTKMDDRFYAISFKSFTGDNDKVEPFSSEAVLDVEKKTLSGQTTERLSGNRLITYRWEASR